MPRCNHDEIAKGPPCDEYSHSRPLLAGRICLAAFLIGRLTRHPQAGDGSTRVSPLTGKSYDPIIQTDYSSETALATQLAVRNISTIICTFIMDNEEVSDAQLRLIRTADRSNCVKRFIPSEFNVDYEVDDDHFPYPEKEYHVLAREALDKTTGLEYSFIYPGMFMDYFGMPKVQSALRPLALFVDPEHDMALIPGDGEARMYISHTKDCARYIALAMELEEWPDVMVTATSSISPNGLVDLFERALGRKLKVTHQPIEKLMKHEGGILPTNEKLAEEYPDRFPGGLQQLRELIDNLEAAVGLGAFDLTGVIGDAEDRLHVVDLVKQFDGKVPPPRRVGELIKEAWGSDHKTTSK